MVSPLLSACDSSCILARIFRRDLYHVSNKALSMLAALFCTTTSTSNAASRIAGYSISMALHNRKGSGPLVVVAPISWWTLFRVLEPSAEILCCAALSTCRGIQN